MKEEKLPVLLERLLQPARYPHPVTKTQLIETHISWVVLTGQFAYKLKKPLNLGFLDFSTLEKRRHACEEELRLNARLAPGLYLAVVPITGTPDDPQLDGGGQAIEYAVKMHEFPQDRQLDRVVRSATPDPEDLDKLLREFGKRLADFHDSLPAANTSAPFGDPKRIGRDAFDNFEALVPFDSDARVAALTKELRSWTETNLAELDSLMRTRKAGGYVREGHGDLHLRNLVLHAGQIVPFDCLEFSPELRWIDVINDVAFLFMDLIHHQREYLAYGFLNAWLGATGDYEALRLLRFYAVYRAMVRAKIAGIELLQHGWPETNDKTALDGLFAHLKLASRLAVRDHPMIVITHGVSGSGKTWVASRLSSVLGAIHVRSDVERKRLFGMPADARSSAGEKPELYGSEASERTYARLLGLAQAVVSAGLPVLVDATFLEISYRDKFASLSDRLGVPFVILDCQASTKVLRARVARRTNLANDASEADLAELEQQLSSGWQLEHHERANAVVLQTDEDIDWEALGARVTSHAAIPRGE